MNTYKLQELAQMYGAKLSSKANPLVVIKGAGSMLAANSEEITFFNDAKYENMLSECKAAAIIVAKEIDNAPDNQLIHPNPYWLFAKCSQLFSTTEHDSVGISDRAFIDPSATIGAGVIIYPNVYVGPNVVVEDEACLYPGVYLGRRSYVGKQSVLYANVVLEHGCFIGARCIINAGTVIGADGFGFAPNPSRECPEIAKIPQRGIVRIEDDVELGALCTIDRAAFGETLIGKGCKFDDKVHIAHNCKVGAFTIISGSTAVAGSTEIGSWVMIGGYTAITGHIKIADRVIVGGNAGVTKSLLESGQTYLGFPAIPAKEWRKQQVLLRRL